MKHPIPPAHWPSAEQASASLLFSPLRVGALELSSRSWVPAMVPWRASPEGEVTSDVLDWYGRFADGQPAVIVVEATGIRDVPSGPLLRIGHERYVEGLARIVEHIRERSAGQTRVLIQLIDFLSIRRRPEPEAYFARFLKLTPGHHERYARLRGEPRAAADDDQALRTALAQLTREELAQVLCDRELADLEYGARERVDDTHLPHIAGLPSTLPELFASAAGRAQAAGFDGVELHYAHAYTMASFLSRLNMRDDGYGGSPRARARLPLEVLAAVRERVGAEFCVGCRMLADEVIEGGSNLADSCTYAEAFAGAGMDFLSISVGGKFEDARRPKIGQAAYPYTGRSGHACMPTVLDSDAPPFGKNLHHSRAIRDHVRAAGFALPVVGAGGLNDFELMERALQEGDCDLVAAARQSLADPDWWRKIALGCGAEITRCEYTNYCEALDERHKQVTCQLWDRDLQSPDSRRDEPRLSSDGKRRLCAPPWSPGDRDSSPSSTAEDSNL